MDRIMVLVSGRKGQEGNTVLWGDPRVAIAYLSVLSVLWLLVRTLVLQRGTTKANKDTVNLLVDDTPDYDSSILRKLEKTTLRLQVVRLLLSCGLWGLVAYMSPPQSVTSLSSVLLLSYGYTIVLSIGTVSLPDPEWRRTLSEHLSLLHFTQLCVYIYRDLFPLATEHPPMDAGEGRLAITRFCILLLTGFLIPIILPRPYRPVDPKNPRTPSKEQTASWLSLAIYSHLDGLVWRANTKGSPLEVEDLPVLPDRYRARYLVDTSFPHLDPILLGRKRHIFWGILRHFRKIITQQFFLMTLSVINEFASPIATLKLLTYLESSDKTNLVKPWVWILWLGLGPAIASIATQGYLYLVTVILVQTEAIIAQLIIEHSLRIRVNSHTNTKTPNSEGESRDEHTRESTASSFVGGERGESVITEPISDSVSEEGTIVVDPSSSTPSVPASTSSGTVRGGVTPKETGQKEEKKQKSEETEDQSGKLMTMITSDTKTLQLGSDWISLFFFAARVGICIIFLYRVLGWSAVAGIAFLLLTLPLPGGVAKILMRVQETKMKKTDARIQNITQVMNVLRMIKLFAWEDKVKAQIAQKREDELRYIRNSELIDAANGALNSFLPLATMMVVYATYTLLMGNELKASVIFPSAAVFSIFRNVVFQAFWLIPNVLRAKVSLDRIGEYLNGGELFQANPHQNDFLSEEDSESPLHQAPYLRDASFTWRKPSLGTHTPTPGKRNFRLHIDGELAFKEGKINLICGPTGCGKTSLLMALLGEMYFHPSGPSSICHLPREGGIAYAAQEAWVINETIRQNILFQTSYDKERYEKVLHQVGLERDLSLLEAGDMAEVGEKGLTLSGGQKARITLARAVYSHAKTLLLDDVLSALDVHTSRWVTEKCLAGDLLKDRTVLLVTHNVMLVEDITDFVVVLGLDGRVASHGDIGDVMKENERLRRAARVLAKDAEAKVKANGEGDQTSPPVEEKDQQASGKLIVKEELEIGHLSWKAAKLYFNSLGGVLFWTVIIPSFFVIGILPIIENWFLGYWSSQYQLHPDTKLPVKLYLLIYGLLLLVDTASFTSAQIVYIFGVIRSSRILHGQLVSSVLAATFRWLDTIPVSRIITRFSQDCQTLDTSLGQYSFFTMVILINLLLSFITVVVSAGLPAVPPAIIVLIICLTCAHLYINAQMPVKRNMSNYRAPILGHASNVITGLVSIRAYDAQAEFKEESLRRIDVYTRTAVSYWNLNRWIGFRMDAIGGFFGGLVVIWLIYGTSIPAGSVGFTLTIISSFSSFLLICIRLVNECEVQANSVERIQQYLEIEHEIPPSEDAKPPAYWPSSGELRVENLSARYSVDGPIVLSELTFHIRSGERIGIVGRTGAGKSTIANALLRTIPIEGTVFFDGRRTTETNLSDLRSNITIIPQHPELLNGTLRENLDPFGEHDDAVLNSALQSAGLARVQQKDDEQSIGLDTEVQAGGSNFSQGQRQILALARAMVRRSRLLILDEATAAIDFETDQAIQRSLRTELHDVTLLTVAHRLKTIMDYDKIMVLDAGKLMEFDTPQALLSKKSGLFYHLVEESSDRDELYRLAGLTGL